MNFTFKNLQNAVATPDELHQNQVVQFRPECNQFISSVGDSDYLPKFHRNPFGIHAKRKQNVAIAYRKRVGSAHKVTTVRGGGLSRGGNICDTAGVGRCSKRTFYGR